MFGSDFFNGVTHQIDKMMGELFQHKNIAPAELKAMEYPELVYWYRWWEPYRDEMIRQQKELAKR